MRFRKLAFRTLAAACGFSCTLFAIASVKAATWPQGLPIYDHIVIVVEENKNYEHVIGSNDAPFINRLATEGAVFTKMYGEEHNSEGNYFWLFGGGNFNVGFEDKMPPHSFYERNLGQQLIAHGFSFKGYSEDLPEIGSVVEAWPELPCGVKCRYARKHVPWVSFPGLCGNKTVEGCANLRFSDFPADFSRLPTVSFVIPNLISDMHGVDYKCPTTLEYIGTQVKQGDVWLRANLGAYYEWAKTHNSLLIVTFDENENDCTKRYAGLTDPRLTNPVLRNRIATVFAGACVKAGEYPEGEGITHVNILRTIEAMYGLGKSGAQQANAEKAGISDGFVIKDVFTERDLKCRVSGVLSLDGDRSRRGLGRDEQ